jgi:hypothetical protein
MARVAREAGFLVACAVAFAALPGGSAYAQLFEPQPYLVYEVPPEPIAPPPVVDLDDQFSVRQDVPVLERWYFMNPVEKMPISPPSNPETITDPELHYRWHTIDAPEQGTYVVKVSNQFGDQVPWTIERAPRFLLAPASKSFVPGEPGPVPPGQHYDCYVAVDAPPAGAVVDLNDQFGPHGPTDVLLATYLCAPVVKTKDQVVYPIFDATDGRDHLACYEVSPHQHSEIVNTRTQFTGVEPDLTPILEDRFLCVPSVKTFEAVPSMGPWGIATAGLLMLLAVFWVARRRVRQGEPA